MGPLLPVLLVGGGIAWMLAWAAEPRTPRDQEPILRDPFGNPVGIPGGGVGVPQLPPAPDLTTGDEVALDTTNLLAGQPLLYATPEPLLVSLPWAGGVVQSVTDQGVNVDVMYVFPELPLPGELADEVITILRRVILVPRSAIFLRRRAPEIAFQAFGSPPAAPRILNPRIPRQERDRAPAIEPRINPDNPLLQNFRGGGGPAAVAGWPRRTMWRRS